MPESAPDISQPLQAKVQPRRWTTKVNVAMVIAVVLVLLIGGCYAIYALVRSQEMKRDMHRDMSPGLREP